jgi:HxlR-like helix-turn-helix
LTAALAAMGGKWKLIVIYWLAESPRQFLELRRLMPRISTKVLTEQLRELGRRRNRSSASDGARSRSGGVLPHRLRTFGAADCRVWPYLGRGHLERLNR